MHWLSAGAPTSVRIKRAALFAAATLSLLWLFLALPRGAGAADQATIVSGGSLAGGGRAHHTASLVGGTDPTIAVIDGASNSGALSSAEFYSESRRSSALGTSADASSRIYHTTTTLPTGNALITGGVRADGQLLSSVALLTASAGADGSRFTAIGGLVAPLEGQTATLLSNGKVLITGGAMFLSASGQKTVTANAVLMDPANGQPVALPQMNFARVFHTATLLRDGTVLIFGGGTQLANQGADFSVGTRGGNTAELFDPLTNQFTSIASAPLTARELHTATLLPDGRVLIAGGVPGPDQAAFSTTEIYNPLSKTFSAGPTMSSARYFHTATALLNGTVLIAGGANFSSSTTTALASTGALDPATNSLSPGPVLAQARDAHTATLMPDGSIVLIGGESTLAGTALASVEIYLPPGVLPPAGATPAPTATPTAAPSPTGGTFTSGSVPPSGFGTVVFSGGTNAQLVAAAGCGADRAKFWVFSGGATIGFIPNAPSFVNAPWNAMFPGTIPNGTILIVSCSA